MEIEDIEYLINVSPKENLQEGCELKCPECGEWSCHKKWEQTYVPCEDCGEHMAIMCPKCEEDFDTISNEIFECRK